MNKATSIQEEISIIKNAIEYHEGVCNVQAVEELTEELKDLQKKYEQESMEAK